MRRRILASVGKALPYDAEVEYLENGVSGEYILSNVKVANDVSCLVDMTVVNPTLRSNGTVVAIHGKGSLWDYRTYALFFLSQSGQSQAGKLNFHGNNTLLSGVITSDTSFVVEINANGTNTVKLKCGTVSESASISNAQFGTRFRILWNYNRVAGAAKTRIKSVKFYRGSTLLEHDIPVRFTNDLGVTEYGLYDKVSGAILKNAGTGSYPPSPDRTT